jgi:Tol biopolymer transport system component
VTPAITRAESGDTPWLPPLRRRRASNEQQVLESVLRTLGGREVCPEDGNPDICGINEGSIVVAARDGSQPRTLITGAVVSGEPPFWTLKWSPMGDRIAFAAATGGQTDYGSLSDLRLVDVATGAVTALRVGAATDALFVISYSPEGDRILFSRIDASDARSLWSVRVDGSDARSVVTGTDFGDWQWQPADQ